MDGHDIVHVYCLRFEFRVVGHFSHDLVILHLRHLEFSQFQVRGHYDRSEALSQYFQTFMWMARADFRIFQFSASAVTLEERKQAVRDLTSAVILCILLEKSGQTEAWQNLDAVIRLFVGRVEAMSFADLLPLVKEAGLDDTKKPWRIEDFENFRDHIALGRYGYQLYAHNLTAVGETFNALRPSMWTESIYTRWLAALRSLSTPTVSEAYPQPLRTQAWANRILNTQLASYTELKHDTLLYAAQPYAGIFICDYPAGFVEPIPEFWEIMRDMATATAEGLNKLDVDGFIENPRLPFSPVVDLAFRRNERIAFCNRFALTMETLRLLAEKEVRKEAFNEADNLFIKGLMNRQDRDYAGATFDGWYPGLYYEDYTQLGGTADRNGSNLEDPLVTDIFTAPLSQDDPGGVLHVGTGNVDLLMLSADFCGQSTIYAGPTMSHYEFWTLDPGLKRLTVPEWKHRVATKQTPRPDWTRNYLIPSE